MSTPPEAPNHPWSTGHLFLSPGAHLTYRVVGPCCRLFDREQLPWPCCRIQWRGKEPSWRRIGRRFVPDLATKRFPSYSVEIVGPGHFGDVFVITLFTAPLSDELRAWWCAKRLPAALSADESRAPGTVNPEIANPEAINLENVNSEDISKVAELSH
ncbi:MAG: hypothetical protein AAGF66_12155 [Cyanobacteria bacterium P01_H01_bin.119]